MAPDHFIFIVTFHFLLWCNFPIQAEAGLPCHQSTCPVHGRVCYEVPSLYLQERGVDEVLSLPSSNQRELISDRTDWEPESR